MDNQPKTFSWKEFFKGKRKELLILFAIALVLIFASWKVFFQSESKETFAPTAQTDTEKKLCAILEKIDGVGEAEVMICEGESGVESVVVVCNGAKDLGVIMDVREAVAAAVGIGEKSVKIYLKKE